jgi:hypothetical protein
MDRYAPVALCCWSRKAVQFCRGNPDLVEVLDEQIQEVPGLNPATGQVGMVRSVLLFGRIKHLGRGDAVDWQEARGRAGRLEVELAPASSELDRPRVLRYHMAPWLRSRPPAALEAVKLEGDPIPFIGMPRGQGSGLHVLEMDLPPSMR